MKRIEQIMIIIKKEKSKRGKVRREK